MVCDGGRDTCWELLWSWKVQNTGYWILHPNWGVGRCSNRVSGTSQTPRVGSQPWHPAMTTHNFTFAFPCQEQSTWKDSSTGLWTHVYVFSNSDVEILIPLSWLGGD